MTPFAQGFFQRCAQAGLTQPQVRELVKQASTFGKEVQAELAEGLVKRAGGWDVFTNMFGSGAPAAPAAPTAPATTGLPATPPPSGGMPEPAKPVAAPPTPKVPAPPPIQPPAPVTPADKAVAAPAMPKPTMPTPPAPAAPEIKPPVSAAPPAPSKPVAPAAPTAPVQPPAAARPPAPSAPAAQPGWREKGRAMQLKAGVATAMNALTALKATPEGREQLRQIIADPATKQQVLEALKGAGDPAAVQEIRDTIQAIGPEFQKLLQDPEIAAEIQRSASSPGAKDIIQQLAPKEWQDAYATYQQFRSVGLPIVDVANKVGGILDPVIGMLGGDAAKMNPMIKLLFLLGGGSMFGSLLSGSGMLGGFGALLLMGGLVGGGTADKFTNALGWKPPAPAAAPA